MIKLAFVIAEKASDWSKMIAKASNSPYSHVELWLDGPQNQARCFSSREPIGASFMIRDLSTAEWEIVVPNLIISSTQAQAFCLGANGKDYDMIGLLGYRLGTGLHDNHDVFCSEVVGEALMASSDFKLLKDPWMTSPGDLYNEIPKIR